MTRARCYWFSWRRTSDQVLVNVRVHVDGAFPLWRGTDILDAAGLVFPGATFDHAHELEGWETNGVPDKFITHDAAQSLVDYARDLALSLWLDATLAAVRNAEVRRPPSVPEPSGLVAIAQANAAVRDRHYTVLAAAQLLSRDPVIRLGRNELLKFMGRLGWVKQEHDAFVPSDGAIAGGWLVRHEMYVPNSKIAYNKIRLTKDGIRSLHRTLGGVSDVDFETPEIPTLVEVGTP